MTAAARKRAEPAAVRAAAIKPQDRLAWHKQLALDHGLPHVALRVGICISTHFNNGTAECFPALPTIAREVGVSIRTVIRAIKKLAKQGHLRVRKGGGRGLANTYVMNVSQPYEPTKKGVTGVTLSSPKQCQTASINSDTGVTPTLKENSKKKELAALAPKKARARPAQSLFPEGWQPPELPPDQQGDFDAFADHARTCARTCADWEAAWRNWHRKSARMQQQERPNGRSLLAAIGGAIDFLGGEEAARRYVPGSEGPRPLGLGRIESPAVVRRLPSR